MSETPFMSEQTRRLFVEQLNSNTCIRFADGAMHTVLKDDAPATIDTFAGPRSFQQICWAMEHNRWEDTVKASCSQPTCTVHLKIEQPQVTDDDLLKLVERNSVSLADLYRKGRARGLIAARSTY
jgi:hypothetical protein